MTITKFLAELAALLEVETANLKDDFSLKKCMNWDSLSIVSTIGLLDTYFNLHVPIDRIEPCETIADLLSLIKQN